MKIRALAPNVAQFASRKRWYEYIPFLERYKWRIRAAHHWVLSMVRRRHNVVRMKALNSGQWYDSDTRMFEASFQILVDYVENEVAWIRLMSECKASWYHRWIRIPNRRELALKHLDWEIQLGNDSVNQSEAAKKIKSLYLWYKDERPHRPDPWDEVPDREIEFEPENEDGTFTMVPFSEEYSAAIQKAAEREQVYEDEDNRKLVQLIQVRQFLWT